MSDGFSFGEPAKRPVRLGKSSSPRARRAFDARLVWVAAGLVLAGALAFVFLRSADEAGKQIADTNSDAIDQIDRAYDAAAQGSVGRAVVVAQTLYSEHGSYMMDLATLSAFDPSVHFTSGQSKDPTAIAYSSTDSAFGAAVLSESGTCWWVKIDVSGLTRYGNGTPCTGAAAMGASRPSW